MKKFFQIKYFYLVCLTICSILEVKSETPGAPTYQIPLTREEHRQRSESIRFMQGSIESHLVSQCVTDILSDENPPTLQVARKDCQEIYDDSKPHADCHRIGM